ncbi:MAG: hypothetical protein ABIK92_21800 [Pseudomonadota bacterium]
MAIQKHDSVTYRSTKESLCLHLRHARKEVHNGEIIMVPGASVRFTKGLYSATDPEISKILDDMLTSPDGMRWRRKFWRLPSQAVAKKMAEAAEVARKKGAEYLDKSMSPEQKNEMSSFHNFIKKQRQRSKEPTVHINGPLDVGGAVDGSEQFSETSI